MKDAHSVITAATDGCVGKLAQRREISERRMHEMLGDQCVYPKSKRLIRDIAAVNQTGARLIKADLDAFWQDVLGPAEPDTVSIQELHKEAYEAIDALLDGKDLGNIQIQLRELIAVAQLKLEGVEALMAKGLRAVE
jgi:energy-converting hydrogenase A subunit M